MTNRAIFLLLAALSLGADRIPAQTMPPVDPPAATQPNPDGANSGARQGAEAARATEDRVSDDAETPPANPPAKDETVGVGSSVDRAPRDVREPFDE